MVFLVLLAILLSVSAAPLAAAAEEQSTNVLLITVDTLRADHLSCYGYHRRTSPNIDKLASEGTRFEKAYTPIPLTGPAHFSLLTSRYPQEHGARINGLSHRKKTKLLFLPQVLRKHGYRNGAFVSAWPLTSRLTHIDQYFDHYDEDMPRGYQVFNSMRWAEDVTPRAQSWLRSNADGPFFLWVHYFDPHEPYNLRKGFTELEQLAEPGYPGLDIEDEAVRERLLRYDSEIAYADHHIGKLLASLDDLELRDSTLVVLASDHGESLGERDYVGHGRFLYEPIVHVPLIFRLPGAVSAGKVVAETVSLIDLSPTIIDMVTKRDQELPIELGGNNLAAALNGGKIDDATARYVTFGGKKGFFPRWISFLWTDMDSSPLKIGRKTGSRKVIWSLRDDEMEIFDVAADPHEQAPKAMKEGSPQYKRETARLKRWYDATEGEAGDNQMTEKDIEILKSLGYLK